MLETLVFRRAVIPSPGSFHQPAWKVRRLCTTRQGEIMGRSRFLTTRSAWNTILSRGHTIPLCGRECFLEITPSSTKLWMTIPPLGISTILPIPWPSRTLHPIVTALLPPVSMQPGWGGMGKATMVPSPSKRPLQLQQFILTRFTGVKAPLPSQD